MLDLRIFAGNSFFYPIRGNAYICFKSLEQRDREKYIEGFNRLSGKSRYNRFFGFKKELTPSQIDELLNVDNHSHIAWTAFDIVGDEPFGVGVGRFKRSTSRPAEAELGLTVIDDYQGRGVGTILLAVMYYIAGLVEVETFTGIILADNVKVVRWFKELGASVNLIKNEYEMRMPVYRDFDLLPKNHQAHSMRQVLDFLKENDFCI